MKTVCKTNVEEQKRKQKQDAVRISMSLQSIGKLDMEDKGMWWRLIVWWYNIEIEYHKLVAFQRSI